MTGPFSRRQASVLSAYFDKRTGSVVVDTIARPIGADGKPFPAGVIHACPLTLVEAQRLIDFLKEAMAEARAASGGPE